MNREDLDATDRAYLLSRGKLQLEAALPRREPSFLHGFMPKPWSLESTKTGRG